MNHGVFNQSFSTIVTNNSVINGNHNNITGNNNVINGQYNVVVGNCNVVKGESNNVSGQGNSHNGLIMPNGLATQHFVTSDANHSVDGTGTGSTLNDVTVATDFSSSTTNNFFGIIKQRFFSNSTTAARAPAVGTIYPDEWLAEPEKAAEHETTCAVCLTRPVCVVALPCAHLALCVSCCRRNMTLKKECVVCRREVNTFTRVFNVGAK
jgi:Zinc finger, C3HC4 type (RING finger)